MRFFPVTAQIMLDNNIKQISFLFQYFDDLFAFHHSISTHSIFSCEMKTPKNQTIQFSLNQMNSKLLKVVMSFEFGNVSKKHSIPKYLLNSDVNNWSGIKSGNDKLTTN